uniref:Uncharacterized protein n=1 Tax=Arundo donax TaxID=35708 RepID=A0A0A9FNN2_ARUDO
MEHKKEGTTDSVHMQNIESSRHQQSGSRFNSEAWRRLKYESGVETKFLSCSQKNLEETSNPIWRR